MAVVDHSLVYQARKFINGANVHCVKTWILCYELAEPHSAAWRQYEKLLREFVTANNLQAPYRGRCRTA